MQENAPSIFVSYASPDRDRVRPFFEWLERNGFNVWMDIKIKPGQNWDFEIKRALDKATFVLCFISHHSFDRRGYLQREIRLAFDKQTEKLVEDIFIIPVLLDERLTIPDQFRGLQFILSSAPDCLERIADSLKFQLERLGHKRNDIQEKGDVYWTSRVRREEWDGVPGYEVELQFLEFHSDVYPNVWEIGDYIKGMLLTALFRHRDDKFIPDPSLFNYGQDKFRRTNTYDAHCAEPTIVGRVISIQYAVDWYGAGAAHPNHHFETYSFVLEPVVHIESLENIFREPDSSLELIQAIVRSQLYKKRIDGTDDADSVEFDREWIDRGTKEWGNFSSFVFQESGIEILFAPYQIAAYAFGPHTTMISYDQIGKELRPEYASALQVEHLI